MSEIEYREVKIEDADELAKMLGDFWHQDKPEESRHEFALVDLAHYMCRVTFAEVAVMNGKLVGIMAVRADGQDSKFAEPWGKLLDGNKLKLTELDEKGAEFMRKFSEAEGKVNKQMVEDAWDGDENEFVLLIISAETRGMGVGSAMWQRASDYFASVGVDRAFLFTDSTCDWQYYEHRGMKRLAETTFEQHKEPLLPERMFLYEYEVE